MMGLRALQADIIDLHRRFGHPTPQTPALPSQERLALRYRFVDEEVQELLEALVQAQYHGDPSQALADVAQECIDVIVVVVGLLVELGVDGQLVWDAVHSANMKKKPDPAGGKAIKPEGWVKPDIRKWIEQQLEDSRQLSTTNEEPLPWPTKA